MKESKVWRVGYSCCSQLWLDICVKQGFSKWSISATVFVTFWLFQPPCFSSHLCLDPFLLTFFPFAEFLLSLTAFFLLVSLSSPLYLLSVGRRRRLWDADSGTLGSLRGPARCITPPPDALSRSDISSQSLCVIPLPWLAFCCCFWYTHYHTTQQTDHSPLAYFRLLQTQHSSSFLKCFCL